MAHRSNYKTSQRDILLDYLESVKNTHITAGDVCEHFKSCGASIGQATVYRRLEKLDNKVSGRRPKEDWKSW